VDYGAPIVGLGELLWDLLPEGPQPGGAPLNFAFHCHQLGHPAVIVSRVGDDELGCRLRAEVNDRGMVDEFVQTDSHHATGTVQVQINASGQPAYTIAENVAYDFLEWDPRLEQLARSARAVCFGTLAQRCTPSRETIQRLVQTAKRRPDVISVFDVNLRQHYGTRDEVEAMLRLADWIKLNEQELVILRRWFGLRGADTDALRRLCAGTPIRLACLTRGERGCLLWITDDEIDYPGVRVSVADTVGAGDAFTAGLLTQILEGRTLRQAADFANRFASLVASHRGGTPTIGRAEVEALSSQRAREGRGG
jgi:fructokinase